MDQWMYAITYVYVFMQSDNDKFRKMQEDESHLPSKMKFRESVKKLKQKSTVSTNSLVSITDINFI